MKCTKCNSNTEVLESRPKRQGQCIRRRRICRKCGNRFSTSELIGCFDSADSIILVHYKILRELKVAVKTLEGQQ